MQRINLATQNILQGLTFLTRLGLVQDLLKGGAIIFGGVLRQSLIDPQALPQYVEDHDIDMLVLGERDFLYTIMKNKDQYGIREIVFDAPYKRGTERIIFKVAVYGSEKTTNFDITAMDSYVPFLDFSPNVLTCKLVKNQCVLGTLDEKVIIVTDVLRHVNNCKMKCLMTPSVDHHVQQKQVIRFLKMSAMGFVLNEWDDYLCNIVLTHAGKLALSDEQKRFIDNLLYLRYPLLEMRPMLGML